MRSGMTLMSVMVAVALAGIVALAVARLLGNQSKTMSVVRLREQREELLKHYKNIVISGWDATRGGCSADICARNSDAIIPDGGLHLKEDLYEYEHLNPSRGTAGRWWKVSVTKSTFDSGAILQADNYAKPESLIAIEVTVEFIRKEHPVVNTKLATREEIVFLHHNTSTAIPRANSTQCVSGHLTQQYEGPLSYAGPLYSGPGGIIQYDFESNYTKCSQVPLVNSKSCGLGALLGFFRDRKTGTLKEQLIKGLPICSTSDFTDDIAQIRGSNSSQRGTTGTEKRTVGAIDCAGRGYVEWMADNELPQCVSGPAPAGVRPERVAGESKPAPSDTRPFRLASKTGDPTDCRDYPDTDPATGAFYTVSNCDVPRYEGIEKFEDTGNVTDYVKYWSDFKELGPRGPCGPTGPPGINDAPANNPGAQYCPGCCCNYNCLVCSGNPPSCYCTNCTGSCAACPDDQC